MQDVLVSFPGPMNNKTIENLKSMEVQNKSSERGRILKIINEGEWTKKTKKILDEFFKPFNGSPFK